MFGFEKNYILHKLKTTVENRGRAIMLLRLRISELTGQKLGWTMKQLSEFLDVEHQTVMYWNQGRAYPRLPTMMKLCKVLNCDLTDLIEG